MFKRIDWDVLSLCVVMNFFGCRKWKFVCFWMEQKCYSGVIKNIKKEQITANTTFESILNSELLEGNDWDMIFCSVVIKCFGCNNKIWCIIELSPTDWELVLSWMVPWYFCSVLFTIFSIDASGHPVSLPSFYLCPVGCLLFAIFHTFISYVLKLLDYVTFNCQKRGLSSSSKNKLILEWLKINWNQFVCQNPQTLANMNQ